MGPSPPIGSTGYAVQTCCLPQMLPSTGAAPLEMSLSFSPAGRTSGSCGPETRLLPKGRGLPACPCRSFHNASLGLIGPHAWSPVDALRLQQTLSGKHGRTQADTLGLQHKSFHRAALLLHSPLAYMPAVYSPPALQSLREGSESAQEDGRRSGGCSLSSISAGAERPENILSCGNRLRTCVLSSSPWRHLVSLATGRGHICMLRGNLPARLFETDAENISWMLCGTQRFD
ncbi:hypothetical protein GGQ10_003080 [Salinibacter ruber]|nr:hypothetical protein [Salinibacter ruber]